MISLASHRIYNCSWLLQVRQAYANGITIINPGVYESMHQSRYSSSCKRATCCAYPMQVKKMFNIQSSHSTCSEKVSSSSTVISRSCTLVEQETPEKQCCKWHNWIFHSWPQPTNRMNWVSENSAWGSSRTSRHQAPPLSKNSLHQGDSLNSWALDTCPSVISTSTSHAP